MYAAASAIEFVGRGHKLLSPEVAASLAREYHDDQGTPLQGQIEPTLQQLAAIDNTNRALYQLGKEHGLDLTHRLPKPESYHFFANREAAATALRDIAPTQAGAFRGTSENVGVIACTGHFGIVIDNERSDDGILAHEAAHAASHRAAVISPPRTVDGGTFVYDMDYLAYGHATTDRKRSRYTLLDEAQTDFMAIRLDRHFGLLKGQPKSLRYPEPLILMDHLITEVAEKGETRMEPMELYMSLEYGALTGKKTALRAMNRYLRAKAEASNVPNSNYYALLLSLARPKNAFAFAHALKLTGAVEGIEEWRRNSNANIAPWMESKT